MTNIYALYLFYYLFALGEEGRILHADLTKDFPNLKKYYFILIFLNYFGPIQFYSGPFKIENGVRLKFFNIFNLCFVNICTVWSMAIIVFKILIIKPDIALSVICPNNNSSEINKKN